MQDGEGSLKELMSNPLLRMNLLFACVLWSCAMFNFYLITFYLKYFPGSIFINSIWFALSDFFSFVISGTYLKKSDNTNRTLLLSFGVSALGALLYLLFYQEVSLIPVFIICSRMGNSMAFNTVYVSNNRFFPTKYLASTYGIVNLVSHLIAVVAPLLAEVADPYPFAMFFINSAIGVVCSFFLQDIRKGTSGAALTPPPQVLMSRPGSLVINDNRLSGAALKHINNIGPNGGQGSS